MSLEDYIPLCVFCVLLLIFVWMIASFGGGASYQYFRKEELNKVHMGRYDTVTGEWEGAVDCKEPVWGGQKP